MQEHYLYFVQQGENGPVKIGITNNIESRLSSIQTGNPQKLNLLFFLPYETKSFAAKDEAYLHCLFSHLNLSGEWFDPKPFLGERLEIIKHHGVKGIPEAQATIDDHFTHYEVFENIAGSLGEIHQSIRDIHAEIIRIGKIQQKYKQHGDYDSAKYIMAELTDTMRDLRWQYHDEPNRKPFNR